MEREREVTNSQEKTTNLPKRDRTRTPRRPKAASEPFRESKPIRAVGRMLSPPKYALNISLSELAAHLKSKDYVTWPKKLQPNPNRDMSKFYKFHQDHGHLTIDCKVLRGEITELLKNGHLYQFLSEWGKKAYGIGGEDKGKVMPASSRTPSPPPIRKTIGVILGGSTYGGNTISSAKNHCRRETHFIARIKPDDPAEHTISFHSYEVASFDRPHNNALVLTLNVVNYEVNRILVDNRSSSYVLFLSALREMEIDEAEIEKVGTTLVGFNGESTSAIGRIKLLVYAACENQMINFQILDCPSAYNIILGWPWIHSIKAMPSTYRQCILFPTKRGIREIKGNQEISRRCYVHAMKEKGKLVL